MAYKFWTESEMQYMRDRYADTPNKEISQAVGRSVGAVIRKAKDMKLRKSEGFLKSKASGRLSPGHKPWNKGNHTYWSECGTFYKKTPPSSVPIGSIRYHERNNQWLIKVNNHPKYSKRWRSYYEYVWTNSGRTVPEGHIVTLRQGKKVTHIEEITAEHLETVTRAELLERNRIQRYPSELHGLMIQLGNARKKLNEKRECE